MAEAGTSPIQISVEPLEKRRKTRQVLVARWLTQRKTFYDSASKAARKIAGSFERALKDALRPSPIRPSPFASYRSAIRPNASTALTRHANPHRR